MAIQYVTEDGTGKSDATSYASISFIKQYWENVRYAFATYSDPDFEGWGNKATQTLEGMYLSIWPGERGTPATETTESTALTQSLSWPRTGAEYIDEYPIENTVVPIEVQNATAEMVYILSTGATIQPVIDKAGNIISYSVAVEGAVKEATKYSEGSSFLARDLYLNIEDALVRITGGASSQFSLSIQRI